MSLSASESQSVQGGEELASCEFSLAASEYPVLGRSSVECVTALSS